MTTTLETPDRSPSASATGVPRLAGVVAAVVAALTALAVAELVAGLVATATSPVLSVGEWVIEHVPAGAKDFAIRTFGTNDKPALVAGTLAGVLVFAVVIGALSARRRIIGVVGIAAFGAIGAATALTRPGATAVAALPSVVGTAVAIAVLLLLLRPVAAPAPPHAPATDDRGEPVVPAPGFDRRHFVVTSVGVAAAALVAGGVGRLLQRRFDVEGVRNALSLPAPASAAPPLPAGVDLGVPGIVPFMTKNADFYRVDTALVVPQLSPATWELKIHGMVERELTLSYADLLARNVVERDITMICVSNEVGGPYASHARWLGVPLKDLLDEVGVRPGADQLVSRSSDGWSAGTPTAAVTDGRDALVAFAMNGEPLPVEHGFPARIVVPGLYGFTSATKWLVDIELTTMGAYDAYWVQRGWGKTAPIKTLTRIDTPRGLVSVAPGKVPIGGVAWAIHRGIKGVEVKIDDGPWQPARLGAVPNADTWVQWVLDWDATPGSHSITARATDATGTVQTEARANPIPDGASGWHSIVALVGE